MVCRYIEQHQKESQRLIMWLQKGCFLSCPNTNCCKICVHSQSIVCWLHDYNINRRSRRMQAKFIRQSMGEVGGRNRMVGSGQGGSHDDGPEERGTLLPLQGGRGEAVGQAEGKVGGVAQRRKVDGRRSKRADLWLNRLYYEIYIIVYFFVNYRF